MSEKLKTMRLRRKSQDAQGLILARPPIDRDFIAADVLDRLGDVSFDEMGFARGREIVNEELHSGTTYLVEDDNGGCGR